MGVREAEVEKYLSLRVIGVGGTTRKWISPGHVGVPDRIVFYKGDVYFVEVKTTRGKLSPMQLREIDRLLSHGANVWTLYGKKDVDKFIQYLVSTK